MILGQSSANLSTRIQLRGKHLFTNSPWKTANLGHVPGDKNTVIRGQTGARTGTISIDLRNTGGMFNPQTERTFHHEYFHRRVTLLGPNSYRSARILLYERSHLYRYLEEAGAQGYSGFMAGRGLAGVPSALQFPIRNGYVSLPRLTMESAGLSLGGYFGYQAICSE